MEDFVFKPLANYIPNITSEELNILQKDQELVGSGSFGSIFRITWTNKTVAVKHFNNCYQYHQNWNEMQLLSSCSSPHIVQVLAAGPDISGRKISFYLMEYSHSGSLANALHKSKPTINYGLKQALIWARQAALATEYLHKLTIIHRDLKPANMLLFENEKKVKLCDFGSTKILNTENTAESGTYGYMAPEVMYCINESKKTIYDGKCDVYSWTITLWELMMRKKPYDKCTNFHIALTIIKDKHHLTDVPNCPSDLKSLIDTGWDFDRDKRPSMSEIVVQLSNVIKQISRLQLDGLSVHADLLTLSQNENETSEQDVTMTTSFISSDSSEIESKTCESDDTIGISESSAISTSGDEACIVEDTVLSTAQVTDFLESETQCNVITQLRQELFAERYRADRAEAKKQNERIKVDMLDTCSIEMSDLLSQLKMAMSDSNPSIRSEALQSYKNSMPKLEEIRTQLEDLCHLVLKANEENDKMGSVHQAFDIMIEDHSTENQSSGYTNGVQFCESVDEIIVLSEISKPDNIPRAISEIGSKADCEMSRDDLGPWAEPEIDGIPHSEVWYSG